MVRYREEATAWELAEKRFAPHVKREMIRYPEKANTHKVTVYHEETGVYSATTGCTRLHTGRQKGGNMYRFNLNTQKCSCRKPQIYHYPCSHIIAVCAVKNVDYESYISPYYSVANLMRKNAHGRTKRGKRKCKQLHNDMDIMDAIDRRQFLI